MPTGWSAPPQTNPTGHAFFETVPGLSNSKRAKILPYQKAFVDKILSISLKYPNVLYTMNNETGENPEWGIYWANYIESEAAAQGKTVQVNDMRRNTNITASDHVAIFEDPANYSFIDISQNNKEEDPNLHWDRFMNARNILEADPARIRPINNNKLYSNRGSEWGDYLPIERYFRNLLAGAASIRFHRPHWDGGSHVVDPETEMYIRTGIGLGLSPNAQSSIQAARMLADEVNLLELEPDANHSLLPGRSSGDATFAMRNDGQEYVVLFHGQSPSSISVDLSSAPGNVEVKWLDVYGAAWVPVTQLSGGSTVTLTRPGGLTQWSTPDGNRTLAVATLKVTATDPPLAPTGLSATAVAESLVQLSWSDQSDNEVGFEIQQASGGGNFATVATATANATSYTVGGLSPSTSYDFRVRAVNGAGESSYTAVSSATTFDPDLTPPSVPAGLSVSGETATELTLSWSAASDNVGVTGYTVYQNGSEIAAVSATSYTVAGLSPETSYSFQVSALDAGGNESALSPAVSGTTLESSLPSGLSEVSLGDSSGTVSDDGDSVTIASTGKSTATEDRMVYYYFTADGDFDFSARVDSVSGGGGSWARAGIMARGDTSDGSRYAAAMARAGSNGNTFMYRENPGSGTKTDGSDQGFSIPKYVRLVRAGDQLTGYVSSDGSSWSQISTAPVAFASEPILLGLATYADHASNEATAEFSELVFVGNGVGSGDPDTDAPTAPSGLSVTATAETSISLSWSASTDDTGVANYIVYRDGSQIATPSGLSYTDSGLSAATSYAYTVSAIDAAGNESAQSASATDETDPAAPADTDAPTVPAGLSVSAETATGLELSWSAATDNVGVTGYSVYQDGSEIATVAATSYTVAGLSPETSYTFQVSASDAAGNESSPSTGVTGTTLESAEPTGWTEVAVGTSSGSVSDSGSSITIASTGKNTATEDSMVYYYFTADGNFDFSARVDSLSGGAGSWARAGIMARGDTSDGGRYAAAMARAGSNGNNFMYRENPGSGTKTDGSNRGFSIPKYVRLVRAGDQLTGYVSSDGSSWSQISSATVAFASEPVLLGLATYADHASSEATAQYSEIVFNGSGSGPGASGFDAYLASFAISDGPGDDSDGDGLTTLLEYAFGGNPTIADGPFVAIDGLSFSFSLSPDALSDPDIQYRVETSTDLGVEDPWSAVPETDLIRSGVDSENFVYEFPDNGEPRSFARVVIENQGDTAATDTEAPTPPPSVSSGVITGDSIGLSWAAGSDDLGVSTYRVYRDGSLIGTTAELSFVDIGLTPSTTYSYQISAVDLAGNESALTGQISETTADSVSSPDNLVSNSSFESDTNADGTPDDWFYQPTASIDATRARTGTNSLKFDGATAALLAKDVVLQPNTEYLIGFWAYTESPIVGQDFFARLIMRDPSVQILGQTRSVGAPTAGWKLISTSAITPGNLSSGRLEISYNMDALDVVWIDDVFVEQVGSIGGASTETAPSTIRNAISVDYSQYPDDFQFPAGSFTLPTRLSNNSGSPYTVEVITTLHGNWGIRPGSLLQRKVTTVTVPANGSVNANALFDPPATGPATYSFRIDVRDQGMKVLRDDRVLIYDPFNISWPDYQPADFNSFWTNTLAAVRSRPLEVQETTRSDIGPEWTEINFNGLTGPYHDQVRGFLGVPDDIQPGEQRPAIVAYPGAGYNASPLDQNRVNQGYVYFAFSVHDLPFLDSRSHFDASNPVSAVEQAKYGQFYMEAGRDVREDYFYRIVFANAARAVDYIKSLPFVDPDRVILSGGSQGGGIALAAASLVPDVAAVEINSPGRSRWDLLTYDFNAVGSFDAPAGMTKQEMFEDVLVYCDTSLHARRITAPIFYKMPYLDAVDPIRIQWHAFLETSNSVDRRMLVNPSGAHLEVPDPNSELSAFLETHIGPGWGY